MSTRVGSLRRRGMLRHGGPDEADEFAGEGRYRDGGPFAVPDEMAIATMQALVCGVTYAMPASTIVLMLQSRRLTRLCRSAPPASHARGESARDELHHPAR